VIVGVDWQNGSLDQAAESVRLLRSLMPDGKIILVAETNGPVRASAAKSAMSMAAEKIEEKIFSAAASAGYDGAVVPRACRRCCNWISAAAAVSGRDRHPTQPSAPRRSTAPGVAPVCVAFSTTKVPLTMTVVRAPLGYRCGIA
jgi:hypothetical protein